MSRSPGNGIPIHPLCSAGGWAGQEALPAGRADSSATLPQLINAGRTRQGLRTLLSLIPPSLPGERRACHRALGRPSRTRNRKRRPTAACEKGGGPFGRGGPTGEDGSTGHLRFLPFPSTFSGWQLTGAMDLAGLLLDEEGTFSLSGFQDFTVRAQSSCSLPLGVGTPGRSPPDPSGMGTLTCYALFWATVESMPTWKPMPPGPEGKASGYKRGTASD